MELPDIIERAEYEDRAAVPRRICRIELYMTLEALELEGAIDVTRSITRACTGEKMYFCADFYEFTDDEDTPYTCRDRRQLVKGLNMLGVDDISELENTPTVRQDSYKDFVYVRRPLTDEEMEALKKDLYSTIDTRRALIASEWRN